ncbi:MAG: 4-hydroxy-3-methylbut-2-enyl diphosphate reductase, partial [Actinomycetales bacterium]|nr:4-hydroxy-3-methylbut-2-enyl diphosphate reductase [Candidatus Phosphoribacter baldrii]
MHREAVRFANEDYDILLIGQPRGMKRSSARQEKTEHRPGRRAGRRRRHGAQPEKVVWLSQTTPSVDEILETVARLRERFPALQEPPSDDICYATQNR